MILTRYVLYALVASLLPADAFGRSGFSLFGGNTQSTLSKPECDGTGIVDSDGKCNGTGVVDDPIRHDREGFKFENPSTDCRYVSQMHIWDSFKHLEKDMSKLFTLIHKNVSFTVVGHHPIAGRYHDLMHFYVNALRRVSMLFFDHADLFEIHPHGIYGGCNAEWSVEEIQFKGVMNSGEHGYPPNSTFVDPP
jgi:ketosteroid isomerase-like protein